ncbi:hypothetical protein EN35_31850 [Rhodococcus qingshengii]|nr:hypothetical protein EN35_31850 [Rhodococcus qingshengii]
MGELLAYLEPDQKEEDDHQPVVDPMVKAHVQRHRAEFESGALMPEVEVRTRSRRICPQQGGHGYHQQQHRGAGLTPERGRRELES